MKMKVLTTLFLCTWACPALAQEASEASAKGSLVAMVPLEAGEVGMAISGGWALALPFVSMEAGYGLGRDFDLAVRYEAVMGLLHFPQITARWIPLRLGAWSIGARLGTAYSFFGLQTQNLNLTSTFYNTLEVAASVQISKDSALVMGVGGEFDWFRFLVVEDEEELRFDPRYDAATARFGLQSRFTSDLNVFILGRVRLPVESVQYQQEQFVVVPFLEAGGAWSW